MAGSQTTSVEMDTALLERLRKLCPGISDRELLESEARIQLGLSREKTKPRRFGLPPKRGCTGTVPGSSRIAYRPQLGMPSAAADMTMPRQQLERLFSEERFSTYVVHCGGDFDAAVDLYRWNAAVTAAFWEPIGHLEVALRNTLSMQLAARHHRLRREGSWLDDPDRELGIRARHDLAAARVRVRQKGKRASEGQIVSELSFGFWRFLITKKLTNLWPDLASAFPRAPDRSRETLEKPIARLHDFRNRLAHHQRIWNRSPQDRYDDLLTIAGYVNPALPAWIGSTSAVPRLLSSRPQGV